jgi:ABC-type spermidine/putrescine transport system permease subunit I
MKTNISAKGGTQFLFVPALLILVVFFFIPLVLIVIFSFMTSGQAGAVEMPMTLANYNHFLTDSYYLKDLLWRTVRLSALATFFAVIIGYIGAFVITRASEKLQPWLIFLNMCPLWVNLVIRTLSLMVILGRDGPINHLLIALGVTERPIQLLYNETAVLIGMVQVSIPFVVLSLYGVLKSIPRDLEHAAMSVGANPISVFIRVILPLSVPGIFAGSILALGINMESFVVPILLGGGRVRFMSVAAYEMATVSNNLPFAAAIGMILLVVTLLMLGVYQWLVHSMSRMPTALRSA